MSLKIRKQISRLASLQISILSSWRFVSTLYFIQAKILRSVGRRGNETRGCGTSSVAHVFVINVDNRVTRFLVVFNLTYAALLGSKVAFRAFEVCHGSFRQSLPQLFLFPLQKAPAANTAVPLNDGPSQVLMGVSQQ